MEVIGKIGDTAIDTITVADSACRTVLAALDALYPQFADIARLIYADANENLRRCSSESLLLKFDVQETLRSTRRQNLLHFGQRGRVSDAHLHGLAVDFVLVSGSSPIYNVQGTDDFWRLLGVSARKYGMVWKGDWPNQSVVTPHVEWPKSDYQTYEAAKRFVTNLLKRPEYASMRTS